MAKPVVNVVLYHVGTLVRCTEEGCMLNQKPRTFTGSGEEWEEADRYAERHETRNLSPRSSHFVEVKSLYSSSPLKG